MNDIDKINKISENTAKEFTISFCDALIKKTNVLESIAKDLGYKYDFSNPSKNNSEGSLVISFLSGSFSSIIAGSIYNIIKENIYDFLTLDVKDIQPLIDSLKREDEERFKFYNIYIERFFEELSTKTHDENILITNLNPIKTDKLGSYKNYGFTNDNINTCYFLNFMKALKITPVASQENALLLDFAPINNFLNNFVREKLLYLYSIKIKETPYNPISLTTTEIKDSILQKTDKDNHDTLYSSINIDTPETPAPLTQDTFKDSRLVSSSNFRDNQPIIKK